MIDAYKIQVSMVLQNGVSAGLAIIMRDLERMHNKVTGLNTAFGNAKSAALGLGSALVGAGIFDVLYKSVQEADKLQKILNQMSAGGISAGRISAVALLSRSLADQTPGETTRRNAAMWNDLRANIGGANATAALPSVSRNITALDTLYPKFAGKEGTLFKALDLAGVGIDPKTGKFNAAMYANGVRQLVAAEISTHGQITPQMLLQVMRGGGFAAQGINFGEWLRSELATILEQGSRAGTGIGAAQMQFIGGSASKKTIMGLERYHLLAPHGYSDDHGHFAVKPGALYGYKDYMTKGEGFWLAHDVLPMLKKMGITTAAGIEAAVAQIYGSIRAARTALASATPAGQAQTARDAAQQKAALAAHPYAASQASVAAGIGDINAAFQNLFTTLGGPGEKPTVAFFHAIAVDISKIDKWAGAHPTAVADIFKGLAAFAAMLGAGGTLTLASAALAAFAGPLGPLVAVAAAGAAAAEGMKKLDQILHGLFPSVFIDNKKGSNSVLDDIHKHGVQVPWWFPLPAGPGGRGAAPDLNLNHYAPGHRYGADPQDGDIHNQSWVPSRHGGARLQTVVYVQLDKKTIAKAVSEEQAHAMSLPSAGPTRFDGRMTPSFPQHTLPI